MFYVILTDIRRQTYIIWFIIPSLLLLLIIETSMFICGISVRSVSKSVCLPVIDSILCFLFNCFVFLSNLFLGRTGFFLTKEIRSFWINFLKLSLRCWVVCFTNTTSVYFFSLLQGCISFLPKYSISSSSSDKSLLSSLIFFSKEALQKLFSCLKHFDYFIILFSSISIPSSSGIITSFRLGEDWGGELST